MRNLAGNQECDLWIAEELRRSRIPAEPYTGDLGEVPSRLVGQLGTIRFRRAWYYWIAIGPVPIEVARKLYADPIGRTDIRVAGHCGCPAPEPPWSVVVDGEEVVPGYHIDSEVGLRLFADAIRGITLDVAFDKAARAITGAPYTQVSREVDRQLDQFPGDETLDDRRSK